MTLGSRVRAFLNPPEPEHPKTIVSFVLLYLSRLSVRCLGRRAFNQNPLIFLRLKAALTRVYGAVLLAEEKVRKDRQMAPAPTRQGSRLASWFCAQSKQ